MGGAAFLWPQELAAQGTYLLHLLEGSAYSSFLSVTDQLEPVRAGYDGREHSFQRASPLSQVLL